ncbi:MAG: response regulator transcription factor [Eubacteriales bacterium]|jgi:two-component system alkaline phosphatase synthesis response regulator PhoP|nr:response regulator transcription factor [Eubacteriales bacterium]
MIYYVEDDRAIRELVVYTLTNSGYAAEGFENGKSFYKALQKTKPQLVLLDIMLPGIDGIEILKRLRTDVSTKNIPVIMVTAKGSEYDKVLGLDIGADDYISKPFGMMELVSRIRAVLRRVEKTDDVEEYCYGAVKLNTRTHSVTVGGAVVDLTLKEFELLKIFLKNIGAVLTRDMLLEKIWGYDFDGETRTVDVHVRTLRQKLGNCGDVIETVRGVGYRIGGPK